MHLPGRKRRYLHGFLRFSSAQPWCAFGSTATKYRKYQCFQLLLSSSVALDLAAAVDRRQRNLVNTSVFEHVLFASMACGHAIDRVAARHYVNPKLHLRNM